MTDSTVDLSGSAEIKPAVPSEVQGAVLETALRADAGRAEAAEPVEEVLPQAEDEEAAPSFFTPFNLVMLGLMVVAVAILTTVGVTRYLGMGAASHIVTFDPVKLGNAERMVASQMLGSVADQGKNDPALILMQASKHTQAVIREVAGPDTIVLVKQAVVQGQVPDITDQVLTRLGLPTKVPTVSLTVSETAPTTLGLAQGPADAAKAKRYLQALQQGQAQSAQQATQAMVP